MELDPLLNPNPLSIQEIQFIISLKIITKITKIAPNPKPKRHKFRFAQNFSIADLKQNFMLKDVLEN